MMIILKFSPCLFVWISLWTSEVLADDVKLEGERISSHPIKTEARIETAHVEKIEKDFDSATSGSSPEKTASAGDDALHKIVESVRVNATNDSDSTVALSEGSNAAEEEQSKVFSLVDSIVESLNTSGLLRDGIRELLEKNETNTSDVHVAHSISLNCAILLYNETVDLPLRIKAIAAVSRAYNALVDEGEVLSKHMDEFDKTLQHTMRIIDESEGRMSHSVREHVAGTFTYENFRLTYAAAALRIQNLNNQATRASREGKTRKDNLVVEIVKYEGLRKCHNLTKDSLERAGIHLSNPANGTDIPPPFEVMEVLGKIMELYEVLEKKKPNTNVAGEGEGHKSVLDVTYDAGTVALDEKDEAAFVEAKITSIIAENMGKLRFYEQLLNKAKVEINSIVNTIVEVNNNFIGLRLLNVLSHILVQNEKIRMQLNRYDDFVRNHRRELAGMADSAEDLDHDEL